MFSLFSMVSMFSLFSMVSMFSTVNMVNMMAMKSTTMIMAVVDVVCSREAKGVLTEEQLLVVCKQVVQRHLAVDGCADDAGSVGALKVASHDLVQLPVTQTHAFKLETFCPQQVNGLLVLVRKPEGVVVPPEFKSLQTRAEFCKAVDHVVDMDLGGDGLGGAHHKDGRAPQLRNVSVPQSVCHVAHPTQSKSLQLATDPVKELAKHVLCDVVRAVQVQGT